jgi:hypothetical protein
MNNRGSALLRRPITVAALVAAVIVTGIFVYNAGHAATVGDAIQTTPPGLDDVTNPGQTTVLDPGAMAMERGKLPHNVPQPKTSCDLFPGGRLCQASAHTPAVSTKVPIGNASTTPCTVAGCGQLSYHGGPVQHAPHVILVEWGPKWSTDTTFVPTIQNLMSSIGVENYSAAPDTWSTTMAQYHDGNGAPSFYSGVGANIVVDTTTPPRGCNQGCLGNEAVAVAKKLAINPAGYANYQVVVATQVGACPDGFGGDPTCPAGGNYCGWHSFALDQRSTATYDLPFINLPMPSTTATSGCGKPSTIANDMSEHFSHEFAETVVSPYLNAWYSNSGGAGGGEIGDECWGGNQAQNMKGGPITVQALYSNVAHGCVYSTGVQGSVIGLGNKCADDFQNSFANATKIDLFDCNHSVAQRAVFFSDGTLRVNGKCLNDKGAGGSSSPVILYDCNGGTNEIWSHNASNEYVLKANGLCLNVKGNTTTNGTPLIVYTCNNAANEHWSLPRAW